VSDLVTLTINNASYGGWKSVRVEAGVERQARSFEVSLTDRWPGQEVPVRRIWPGDACEVRIGNDLVVTGYVDATPVDYDGNGYTLLIRGRSATADLVDCSADNPGGQWRGRDMAAIATDLAGRYGLTVISETDTGTVLPEHQIQPGETAFESLDRLARLRQVLVTDNEKGEVLLASPGSGGQAATRLELGINILAGSAGFDFSEVYSHYRVKGQRAGNDEAFGADVAAASGSAIDTSLKRNRVLIVRQTGQADPATCAERASYEQQVRSAKANEIRYTVVGWRQTPGGPLWRPNIAVLVVDSIMGVNASLLVSEVVFSLDEQGQRTELVVVPSGAFATQPDIAKKRAAKGKKTDVIDWDEL
jgi:prophage tail gpP-like protein